MRFMASTRHLSRAVLVVLMLLAAHGLTFVLFLLGFTWRNWVVAGIAILDITLLLIGSVQFVPRFLAPDHTEESFKEHGITDGKDKMHLRDERLKLQNEVRAALLQGLGGVALLIGILFTWWQIDNAQKQSDEQLALTGRQQIADAYSRSAVELGGTTESRIGGISSLERVANVSKDDHDSVIRLLSAFLRSVSRVPPTDDWAEKGPLEEEMPELQEAMDALIRLRQARPSKSPIKLTGAYLIKGRLENADLASTRLDSAEMQGADLSAASLSGANLSHANLQGSELCAADLRGADLTKANLQGASADSATRWPKGFNPVSAGVKMQSCP
jgi:Pentapeptide repeats (8 copies)